MSFGAAVCTWVNHIISHIFWPFRCCARTCHRIKKVEMKVIIYKTVLPSLPPTPTPAASTAKLLPNSVDIWTYKWIELKYFSLDSCVCVVFTSLQNVHVTEYCLRLRVSWYYCVFLVPLNDATFCLTFLVHLRRFGIMK